VTSSSKGDFCLPKGVQVSKVGLEKQGHLFSNLTIQQGTGLVHLIDAVPAPGRLSQSGVSQGMVQGPLPWDSLSTTTGEQQAGSRPSLLTAHLGGIVTPGPLHTQL
jgi:hypothetical protein